MGRGTPGSRGIRARIPLIPGNSRFSQLVKLAKRLKKEKVNVDIINFGEEVRIPGILGPEDPGGCFWE